MSERIHGKLFNSLAEKNGELTWRNVLLALALCPVAMVLGIVATPAGWLAIAVTAAILHWPNGF